MQSILAIAAPPFAHETWFVSDGHGTDWAFAGEALTLGLLAAALVVTLGVRALSRVWSGVDVPFLARLAALWPWHRRERFVRAPQPAQ